MLEIMSFADMRPNASCVLTSSDLSNGMSAFDISVRALFMEIYENGCFKEIFFPALMIQKLNSHHNYLMLVIEQARCILE